MYRALQKEKCLCDSFFSRSKLTVHFTQQQQKESSANSSNIHARLPGQDSTVKEVLMQGKWKGEIFFKKKKKTHKKNCFREMVPSSAAVT